MASCSVPYSVKIIAETGQILQSIPLHFYCPQIAVSTQLTWNRLELDSTASIPGKGEEVMKRINTLLLILANSEALHGKSGVTGILEEGHLAIRKFQRDVVTARHTVDKKKNEQ
ncbi:uncharacterized protein AAG666_016529 isoform 1-T1 [Megaptera novaeangliae]